jgi:hypothetical protein
MKALIDHIFAVEASGERVKNYSALGGLNSIKKAAGN